MQPSIPSAAIRASLSAISRVWKATGPEFFLEEIDDSTILASGDFLITVVFHLKETSEDTPLFEAIVRAEESKRLQEEADVAKKESSSSSLPARITLDDALSLIAPANDDDVDAVDEEEEEEEDATRPPPPQHRPVVPPQLCVSFVVSVVGQQSGGGNELLVFENDELPGSKKAPRSVCFELFGNGSNGDTFAWSFINEDDFEKDASPLQSLKIVAATSFRHRFVDLDTKKWVYDRKEVVERSWILTSIDMPFPHELIELNLDYLANFLLLGILIPETLHNDLADCVETRGLCRRAMLLERYEAEGKLKPLKLTKAKVETIISTASKLHHLAHVGHIGIIVESSLIVGGAAYDAVYDPQNLARNAKKRGKLATAATAGGIIGGVVGVLIPIPGLFLALSVAGSYAGRWIAGKFITDDGTELPDVVPVGGLRSENDEVTEVIQDFDEDAPVWKKTWNRLTQAKKQNSQKALPAPPTSALLLIEQPQTEQSKTEAVAVSSGASAPGKVEEDGKALSWPNTQVWAQKASSWTNSIWNAIQPKQQQQQQQQQEAQATLIDMSAPSSVATNKPQLSSLPMDLFAENTSTAQTSGRLPDLLFMNDDSIKSEEPVKIVVSEKPAQSDLLMFSFEEEAASASKSAATETKPGRVRSYDLLQFQM